MANTPQDFTQPFLTYKDVREANPDWTDRMIEDYLSLKRDLTRTAETGDDFANSESGTDPLAMALINDMRRDIGSGNPLTSDETGFTVDSDKLTVDQTEA